MIHAAFYVLGIIALGVACSTGLVTKRVDIVERTCHADHDNRRRKYVRTAVSVLFLRVYVAYRPY